MPSMERLIVLDTETTGIRPEEGHRIIEIGAVQILNREITNTEFHKYVQPNRPVGDSVNIHGITDKFLINKPQFDKVSNELLSFIKGATLIIHNAPFDLGFLNNELKINGIDKKIEDSCQIIDTLELSKEQRPGTMHNLDALCRRFGVDTSARTRHGALLDAQILAQVYLAMTGGQSILFQESSSIESQISDPAIIKNNIANKDNIKVIYANKKETDLHDNYFK
ncbi:MAG: DNA polymerase III subunit epsilon [Candidatus Thioglobus sp.]|jgi:DNA polymerase-3 subunit epsilon|nr:DNA polymerase III subunit epsilon [Candidatus Pseudothioglobus aerophilus]MBT3439702.1 DNA polymerase III subunit epsilon [Gammaproteobacteria bacterium]MDO7702387.1 DNA polymerase III subunit epsilon [SAR86 cluster bacterium]MDP0559959.1 DNA polymerase III subunit epsilon [Candidatus Thioglobus sp.]MBT4245601.1 DNA polymerase III subunit epsilon [Gammaproteobacteria bacterium]